MYVAMRITSAASLAKLLQYRFFFFLAYVAKLYKILLSSLALNFFLPLMCSFYCMRHFMSISHLAGRVI